MREHQYCRAERTEPPEVVRHGTFRKEAGAGRSAEKLQPGGIRHPRSDDQQNEEKQKLIERHRGHGQEDDRAQQQDSSLQGKGVQVSEGH